MKAEVWLWTEFEFGCQTSADNLKSLQMQNVGLEIEGGTCCIYLWYIRMTWDAFETDESQWLIVNSYIHAMLVWVKIVSFWHFDGMIPILISWNKPLQVII